MWKAQHNQGWISNYRTCSPPPDISGVWGTWSAGAHGNWWGSLLLVCRSETPTHYKCYNIRSHNLPSYPPSDVQQKPHCLNNILKRYLGFPLFYWQKNPGHFHDFPGPPWEIFQDLFGAQECLNRMKNSPKGRQRGGILGERAVQRAPSPPARGSGGAL